MVNKNQSAGNVFAAVDVNQQPGKELEESVVIDGNQPAGNVFAIDVNLQPGNVSTCSYFIFHVNATIFSFSTLGCVLFVKNNIY